MLDEHFSIKIASSFQENNQNCSLLLSFLKTQSIAIVFDLLYPHKMDQFCRIFHSSSCLPLNYPKLHIYYIYKDGLLEVSTKKSQIFNKITLIQDGAVLSIQDMLNPIFWIDMLQNFVSIIFEPSCIDD